MGGMNARKRSGPAAAALATCLALALALWLVEQRRRRRAEDAFHSTAALAAALADSGVAIDAEARRQVAELGSDARQQRVAESARAARQLAERLAPHKRVFGDPGRAEAAKRFFRQHADLERRFVELTDRGRQAEQEGRDPARLRRKLGLAATAAAADDEPAMRGLLDEAEAASRDAPFRVRSPHASGLAGAPAAQRARAILLECERPASLAKALMTEGAAAVGKVDLLARRLLAAGRAEEALWLADIEAHLLGRRNAPEQDAQPPAEQPKQAPELPAASADSVRKLLETGQPLLSAKQASGQTVYPADELLAEAARLLDGGRAREAALLARAALNVLGMNDRSLSDLVSASQGGAEF